MNRGFKGVWIPKEVWEADDLGWTEKLLLVEIESLDNEDGCFASNDYLASFFKLSKDRISRIISKLREKGYISTRLIYKEGTRKIERRIIKVNKLMFHGINDMNDPIGENTNTPRRKHQEGIGGNANTPIGENAKDNNTSFNNTFNSTTNNAEERQRSDLSKKLDNLPSKENPVVVADQSFGELIRFYEQNIGMITPMISEELGLMTDDLNAELALLALKESVIANARNKLRYAQSILKSWKSQNFKTISDIENAEKRRKSGGDRDGSNQPDHESKYDYGF